MSKCCRQVLIAIVSAILTLASAWIAKAQESPTAKTQPVTISERGLQMLSDEVVRYVERDLTVGAELLVIQADRVLLHEFFGCSDRDSEKKWQKGKVCKFVQ